jgi:hypothetical protein
VCPQEDRNHQSGSGGNTIEGSGEGYANFSNEMFRDLEPIAKEKKINMCTFCMRPTANV